ncbi:class I SAM-dependent methyltransferase [Catenuloplanes atrovinosus]|uniref:Nicotinamide N-methyase n=1 Tax=Catenuloplanes atrovinosus TaxID=137266 RepID=A0AAE3YV71_9ACTN|nr:50S ribosomal protein L11 methyltransferase [Catenuloplanes atrovinosus]MDR7279787.1 putative nicotinamide N-methyase [Catenuloplanes atrovinosus]
MSHNVTAHASLAGLPFLPELRLYQAGAEVGLWTHSGGAYASDRPPPFWAFAWAGGQGLARYVLDHPDLVAGRRVLDLAAGSGLIAVAAARAGAAQVTATDVDDDALDAIRLNAEANGVAVGTARLDLLDPAAHAAADEHDVVLAGDVFYTEALAGRARAFLRRAARAGALVLVGDARRGYLPERLFTEVAAYDVPVPRALEETRRKRAMVYRLT